MHRNVRRRAKQRGWSGPSWAAADGARGGGALPAVPAPTPAGPHPGPPGLGRRPAERRRIVPHAACGGQGRAALGGGGKPGCAALVARAAGHAALAGGPLPPAAQHELGGSQPLLRCRPAAFEPAVGADQPEPGGAVAGPGEGTPQAADERCSFRLCVAGMHHVAGQAPAPPPFMPDQQLRRCLSTRRAARARRAAERRVGAARLAAAPRPPWTPCRRCWAATPACWTWI
jgi:hypothetical protein